MNVQWIQAGCAACGTTADINPGIRSGVSGQSDPPPAGECRCGQTKVSVAS